MWLGTFNGFSKRKILYFATCFCFVLALLLGLSFSFLISLLTNFSSGVFNALKARGAFLTFGLSLAEFVSLGIATSYGKQNKMLLRRLPGRASAWEKMCTRTPMQEQKQFLDLTQKKQQKNIYIYRGLINKSAPLASLNNVLFQQTNTKLLFNGNLCSIKHLPF